MRFILLAILIATGCAQTPVDAQPETATTVPAGNAGDVFSNPAAFSGQTVTVDGVFQGYRADACRFAASARSTSLTRSDWLLRRDSQCLYVTGGLPPGFDPLDPASAGREVELRARVIDGGGGTFLLQMVEARPR